MVFPAGRLRDLQAMSRDGQCPCSLGIWALDTQAGSVSLGLASPQEQGLWTSGLQNEEPTHVLF